MTRSILTTALLVFTTSNLSCDTGRPVGGNTDGWNTPTVKICKAVQCEADADCDSKIFRGGCITATGMCAMCKKDADCNSPVLFKGGCNTATGMCAMCKKDTDCQIYGVTILTGKCDSAFRLCIKCDKDADCPGNVGSSNLNYCSAKKHCTSCKSDSQCPPSQTCDALSCVPGSPRCTSNTQCQTPLICNGGRCSCDTAADCTAALGLPSGVKKWACR